MALNFCFGDLPSECKLPKYTGRRDKMELQSFMLTIILKNRTQTTKKTGGHGKKLSAYF